MELRGHVHNGVVVPEDRQALPEGAVVHIVIDTAQSRPNPPKGKRVTLPLVPSKHPGTLRLTAEDVARALEDDYLAS